MVSKLSLKPHERVIVAVDFGSLDEARMFLDETAELLNTIKFGLELGTAVGWGACADLAREYNLKIFFDTKFKDIPNTVQAAARSLMQHKPAMFTVYADTQPEMLEGAVSGVREAGAGENPLILGVSVLTSMSNEDCKRVYGAPSEEKVKQFAQLSAKARFDGVACSAHEAKMLRENPATADLVLVTPGIRPKWAQNLDQKRTMTPREALQAGSDYLVVGRPITQPPAEIGSSAEAIKRILEEIGSF